MKFFIDTADINEIEEGMKLGVVDGVTTNPSLVAKTGKDFYEVVEDILKAVGDRPVSLEVIGTTHTEMINEARNLKKRGKNVVVKIPMTEEGLMAVKTLSDEGIDTNVTLVFSPLQALLAAKAGATYISPFVGRLDDISNVGMDLIEKIRIILDNYDYESEIIVASVRNPLHVLEAAIIGADIATIPLKVIKQLTKHPLTDIGIEKFLQDWEKVPGNKKL
ncbi:fructose-6-phosphate aldolase [Thermodesulfobacteriota bacterium]